MRFSRLLLLLLGLLACLSTARPWAMAQPGAAHALAGTDGDRPTEQAVDEVPVAAKWAQALQSIEAGQLNVHSVLVMQAGQLVVERYRAGQDRGIYSLWSSCQRFGPDDLHDMRSVSKSVIGLLYGILLERGQVPGLETSVASLYPDEPEFDRPPKDQIRIRHLLTMSAGLDWDEPSPVHRPQHDDQIALLWARAVYPAVFDRDVVAAPGERFVYSGGLTAVLVDVMERSTGRGLLELVESELFRPLGIVDWTWSRDLRGRPLAYAGLRLRPRDLLKLGELVLNLGRWGGRQLVPAAWIEAASSTQVQAGEAYGYGYLWWTRAHVAGGAVRQVAQAIGNGGQRIYVVPALDLVVAMTAGDYGQPEILTAEDGVFDRLLEAASPAAQPAARVR